MQLLLEENDRVRGLIPDLFEFLMPLHLAKVDKAISPGLTSLKWNSLDINSYTESVSTALQKFELLIRRASNIMTVRIDKEMVNCASLVLCELPDADPWTTEEFLCHTKVSYECMYVYAHVCVYLCAIVCICVCGALCNAAQNVTSGNFWVVV